MAILLNKTIVYVGTKHLCSPRTNSWIPHFKFLVQWITCYSNAQLLDRGTKRNPLLWPRILLVLLHLYQLCSKTLMLVWVVFALD